MEAQGAKGAKGAKWAGPLVHPAASRVQLCTWKFPRKPRRGALHLEHKHGEHQINESNKQLHLKSREPSWFEEVLHAYDG